MTPIETKIAHGTAIDATAFTFEFRNDLHGTHFGRARKRSGWESRPEKVKGVFFRGQLAFDL